MHLLRKFLRMIMSDNAFVPMPVSCIMAVLDETLSQGFARAATMYCQSQEEMDEFEGGIAVKIEPPIVAEYVAKKLEYVLGMPVKPVADKEDAKAKLVTKIDVSFPDDADIKRMAQGGIFIPQVLENWCGDNLFEFEANRDHAPSLIVSREKNDVGLLVLDKGHLQLDLVNERTCYWEQLSLNDLSDRENLHRWLWGFLPSFELLAIIAQRMGYDLNELPQAIHSDDPKDETRLFNFFRRFGFMLPGGIRFREPLLPRFSDRERSFSRMKTSVDRGMPEYASTIGFPYCLFPDQTSGFVMDCHHGYWNGGKLSGHYFLPESSYGRERILNRLTTLNFARYCGIPTVNAAYINAGKLRGLALERFDMLGGKPVWREHCDQFTGKDKLPDLSVLSEVERRTLFKRYALGEALGFNGLDFTVIECLPDVYPGNGPDADDLHDISDIHKRHISLAEFSGVGDIRTLDENSLNNIFDLCFVAKKMGISRKEAEEIVRRIKNKGAFENAVEEAKKQIMRDIEPALS